MSNKIFKKVVVLTLVLSICFSSTVFASGEVLSNIPSTSSGSISIEPKATIDDVVRYYSSYQGKTVTVTEVRTQSNGDRFFYRGTLNYIGRKNGWYGDYFYLGDFRTFTLYKIITKGGSVITPNSL